MVHRFFISLVVKKNERNNTTELREVSITTFDEGGTSYWNNRLPMHLCLLQLRLEDVERMFETCFISYCNYPRQSPLPSFGRSYPP